jgi:hypothetical protein
MKIYLIIILIIALLIVFRKYIGDVIELLIEILPDLLD